MRAILIDPEAKTVTEVDYIGKSYRDIYDMIDCETFTVVGIEHDDAIYVDDEGLLKDDPQFFFTYRGYAQPLAGKGLVLGTDEDGNSTEPVSTLDDIKNRVRFVELKLEGFEDISGAVDHPILGPNTPMIGHRPIFRRRT